MYKIELHSHCKSGSCDSMFNEEGLVKALSGFDGFVLSNHYDEHQLSKMKASWYCNGYCPDCVVTDKRLKEEDFEKCYSRWLLSIEKCQQSAKNAGIKCYAGMEYSIVGAHLGILGCTLDDFIKDPIYPGRDLEYVLQYAHRHGAIVIQNHPYRRGAPVKGVDGYELWNTKHDRTDILIKGEFPYRSNIYVCGEDIHYSRDIGKSYTEVERLPDDEKDLVRMLIAGEYVCYVAENLGEEKHVLKRR